MITGPRLNGRCGRWQTFTHGRPGERPLLGLTDGNGINLFDPLNGDRVACGDLRNSPPNGPLPTISFKHDTSGWFVFLRDQIIRLGLADGDEEDCPSRRIITPEWSSPVMDGLQLNGSQLILSANGDGPTILTSVWRSDVQRWSVDTFTTDGQITLHQNARLLHASETPNGFSLLVLENPDRSGELGRDGCVHLSVSQNGEVLSRSRLGAHCEVIRSPRDPYRSREFHGPAVVQVEGETLWFARVFDALEHVGEATSHLARFGDDGSVERLDVGRPIRRWWLAVAKFHAESTETWLLSAWSAMMDSSPSRLKTVEHSSVSRNPPHPDVRRPWVCRTSSPLAQTHTSFP